MDMFWVNAKVFSSAMLVFSIYVIPLDDLYLKLHSKQSMCRCVEVTIVAYCAHTTGVWIYCDGCEFIAVGADLTATYRKLVSSECLHSRGRGGTVAVVYSSY